MLLIFGLGAGGRVAIPKINFDTSATALEDILVRISTGLAPELIAGTIVQHSQCIVAEGRFTLYEQVCVVRTGDEVVTDRVVEIVADWQRGRAVGIGKVLQERIKAAIFASDFAERMPCMFDNGWRKSSDRVVSHCEIVRERVSFQAGKAPRCL